jgi:hypothetical protein
MLVLQSHAGPRLPAHVVRVGSCRVGSCRVGSCHVGFCAVSGCAGARAKSGMSSAHLHPAQLKPTHLGEELIGLRLCRNRGERFGVGLLPGWVFCVGPFLIPPFLIPTAKPTVDPPSQVCPGALPHCGASHRRVSGHCRVSRCRHIVGFPTVGFLLGGTARPDARQFRRVAGFHMWRVSMCGRFARVAGSHARQIRLGGFSVLQREKFRVATGGRVLPHQSRGTRPFT